MITVRNRFPLHRFVGPRLSTASEPAECISHIGHPPAPEDGTLKRTLALVLGLAAVLLFAPVARADFHGGKSPYRDAAPLGHASGMQPADGEHDGDGDDHDGDANDQGDSHDHSGDSGSHGEHDNDTDDHDSDDQGTGDETPGSGSDNGNQPGTNPGTPSGPSTQSVGSNPGVWLWVLLVVIAGAAVSTAYVLRRRKMRAR